MYRTGLYGRTMARFGGVAATALSALAATAAYAGAPPTVLYSFKGLTDGGEPEAGVFFGQDGALYGAAGSGGIGNNGTIFTLTPPAKEGGKWSYKVIARLQGGAGGGSPQGLIQGADGTLYGYALNFGTADGYGTVFRLTKEAAAPTGWRFQTLHRFTGGTDGAYPNGLTLAADGSLIGTASHGGQGACRFPGSDQDAGCGVVFKLTPSKTGFSLWTETILHRFTGGAGGALPNAAPVFYNGAYYGVTVQGGSGHCIPFGETVDDGCGTVYKLAQTKSGKWTQNVAFSFIGGANGWSPIAGLTPDGAGKFYGVTAAGGTTTPAPNGKGVAYQLTLKGKVMSYRLLHAFNGGFDGESPQSPVVLGAGGQVFGTTYLGGSGGLGTVYDLQPPLKPSGKWSVSMISAFSSTNSGPTYPVGKLAIDSVGRLYGVSLHGGKSGAGTIYMVNP